MYIMNIHREELIGKTLLVEAKGFEFEVMVTDYRNLYGRDRYRVCPIAGHNHKWIEKFKLTEEGEPVIIHNNQNVIQ